MRLFVFIVAFILSVSIVQAENIHDLDVGDGAYLQGILSDELVYIVRIDIGNNRVKVRRNEDGTTKWVSPSQIISRESSTANDVGRTAAGIGLVVCLLNPEACKDTSQTQTQKRPSTTTNVPRVEATKKPDGLIRPLAPDVAGTWTTEGKAWIDWTSNRLAQHLGKSILIKTVRTKPIPFYSSYQRKVVLIEAIPTYGEGAFYVVAVVGGGENAILSGNGAPIHAFNKTLDFSVDSSQKAESYLKFFTSAIASDNGIFSIVDQDVGYVPHATLNRYGVTRPTIYGNKEDGWKVFTNQIYGNDIYKATFLVKKDGTIEMEDDSLLGELPFYSWVVVNGARREYLVK